VTVALVDVIGRWGIPADGMGALGLALGIGLLPFVVLGPARVRATAALVGREPRAFGWLLATSAALGSLAYVAFILRGGPRIVDATTYFFEARSFAQGSFWADAGFPSASTRGRFLLYDAEQNRIAGLFPPGYPALLAVAVRLGAPLALGPVLAALLALATVRLVRLVAEDAGLEGAHAELVARAAGLLSVVCAALRYHTADTMSHGVCALYVAVGLGSAIRARKDPTRLDALVVGLCLGGLAATRPVSALPFAATVASLVFDRRARALQWILVGALPGLVLLAAWQRSLTGSALGSPQLVYYAVSDGPPGCFRYGFGRDVGCLFEHGDFVRHALPRGYDLVAALGTTGRRLKMHLTDATNLEVGVVLVLVGIVRHRASRSVRALGLAIALQILAYAPFYFDGNYPGGGARFFADVLPLEHTLVVLALASAAPRATEIDATARGLALLFVSAALGVAFHTSHDHRALRDREGGAPFFLPDALAEAHVESGLVFVDTDHGFSLGHEPSGDVRIARLRGDDHDWLLFDGLGRPPTYRYRQGPELPLVAPWAPAEPGPALRFEAEADWPPLAQSGGYAIPIHSTPDTSGGRVLSLVPTTAEATADIAVPWPKDACIDVVARVRAAAETKGSVAIAGALAEVRGKGELEELPPLRVTVRRGESRLTLRTSGGPLELDRLTVAPCPIESLGTSSP
jgi:hypothetical protein